MESCTNWLKLSILTQMNEEWNFISFFWIYNSISEFSSNIAGNKQSKIQIMVEIDHA